MKTLVLLSGGLDSTAALFWALHAKRDVACIYFYYGQPAAERELRRAIDLTRDLKVRLFRCDLQSVFYGTHAGLFMARDSAVVGGRDTAFVPARNPVFLSTAAACACGHWQQEPVELVVGYNTQDAAGFPDCRREFIEAMEATLNAGGNRVTITAPWLDAGKSEIVRWVEEHTPERLAQLENSWSCYRFDGPCGVCTPCLARAGAGFPSPSGGR